MSNTCRLFIITVAVLLLLVCMVTPHAVCDEKAARYVKAGEKTEAVKVNNASCPICGDQIIDDDAPSNSVKIEYDGKIYSMDGQACASHFKKHPAKFARKVQQDMQ